MARTTQQVFDSHREAMDTGNFGMLLEDYADDAVLLTFAGAFTGKQGVASFFQNASTQYPNFRISIDQTVINDDTVLAEWSAVSDVGTGRGVDTFIIQDGKIQRQTVWMEVFPNE
jgi:predicted SnoaL-like aldol condensation-catalyzing enzyme